MNLRAHSSLSRRQRGVSLIELMVGIVIAMIAMIVIYQVFNVAEGIKRNVTGAGDAQQNGLLSTFGMALQFANAGANMAVNAENLDACPYGTGVYANDAVLRPVPVLISDSGDDATSDSFTVSYGAGERLVTGVSFKSAPKVDIGDAGGTYVVQSPLGFAKGDVALFASDSSAGAGMCATTVVTDVSAPDADGYVTVTHGAVSPSSAANVQVAGTAKLLNIGPLPRRYEYSVDSNGTLLSHNLFHTTSGGFIAPADKVNEVPVPIANNIVLMKVQYGIADPTTGALQKWVKAIDSGDDKWSANSMLTTRTYKELSLIKAVRIGVVVRSESYDRCAYADVCPSPTTNAFNFTLFSECDGVPCPDPVTGSLDPTPTKGNFRYRVYETVVPLRNAVWNKQKS